MKNIASRSLRIFVDICITYEKSYHFRILSYTRYIVFHKIDFILHTDIARTRNASPHSGEYICRGPRNAIQISYTMYTENFQMLLRGLRVFVDFIGII